MTYEECAAAGMSQIEAARAMGVSAATVCQYAKRHGLTFRDGRLDAKNVEARKAGLRERYRSTVEQYERCAAQGLSQAETSRDLGVSREAVRLMANKHGITFRDGKRVKRAAE